MTTSNLSGKTTHNTDTIIGWIIAAALVSLAVLTSTLVLYKFLTEFH